MRAHPIRLHEVSSDKSLDDREQCLFVDICLLSPEIERNLVSDNCCDPNQSCCLRSKASDTTLDDLLNQAGHHYSVQFPKEGATGSRTEQPVRFEGAHELH